jgi:hypothetical protein
MPAGRSKQRRSLSHVGGPLDLHGDARDTEVLAYALDVRSDEETARAHAHGFHSYPARLHPLTARRFVEKLSAPRALVLDPFCGSGTVLIESLALGRRAAGVDANPLAIELTWLKTRGATRPEAESLVARAEEVHAVADDRRRRKAGATRRYDREDVALFDPHVLLELDGLRAGLFTLPAGFERRALFLVLSAILVKVSRRAGDTAYGAAPKRIAAGFTSSLFADKARELARRLEAFRHLAPGGTHPVSVRLGDARALPGDLARAVDLIVTSPPYPGNYDYLAQHDLRLRWLGLDARAFDKSELGARRHLSALSESDAIARWSADMSATLSSMSNTLARGGAIVVIMADSVMGRKAVYADDLLRRLTPAAKLELVAIGSQPRPHFHGPTARAFREKPRREHAVVLRP